MGPRRLPALRSMPRAWAENEPNRPGFRPQSPSSQAGHMPFLGAHNGPQSVPGAESTQEGGALLQQLSGRAPEGWPPGVRNRHKGP